MIGIDLNWNVKIVFAFVVAVECDGFAVDAVGFAVDAVGVPFLVGRSIVITMTNWSIDIFIVICGTFKLLND